MKKTFSLIVILMVVFLFGCGKQKESTQVEMSFSGEKVLGGGDFDYLTGIEVSTSAPYYEEIYLPVDLVLHKDGTGYIEVHYDEMLEDLYGYFERRLPEILAYNTQQWSSGSLEDIARGKGYASADEYFEDLAQNHMNRIREELSSLEESEREEFTYTINGSSLEMDCEYQVIYGIAHNDYIRIDWQMPGGTWWKFDVKPDD